MTQKEKAKAYDEAIIKAKELYNQGLINPPLEHIFPELKESESENIRKTLIDYFNNYKTQEEIGIKTLFGIPTDSIITWLEKQGQSKKTSIWRHWKDGIAGNGNGIPVFLIKNGSTYSLSSCLGFECDYIELSELENLMLEKQGEQNYEFHGIAESRPVKGTLKKLVDNIEKPKFKVKYANNEYNVLEIKEIAGITYFGIEDEPNHIDYVLPDNCEIVSGYGYGVKEKGSPYPTKSAIFLEQNLAWSEEDEVMCQETIDWFEQKCFPYALEEENPARKSIQWLKSLKQRMQ